MSSEAATIPLIPTKLHRPPVARDHLHRQHLLDRLNQRRNRPLTLISASAGYGKTTLVSCWLEACDIPGGWVSLHKNDNDLRMFTAYFIAAVERLFPGACRNTQALLNAPDLPPIQALASSLLNELGRIERPYIMVLDDYYLIEEEVVHNLVVEILRYPSQSLHLVIVGRWDPPLPISTLRAQGLVTEIRAQDLRFNEEETATFLERLLGIKVDNATAAALEKRTEGWVTGLRLAALSMRHRGNIDAKLLESHVGAQYVMEYLFAEIFSQQPPEISQYLLGTAILDRFCGSLCEVVCPPLAEPFTGEIDGREFITWLEKENMFLIPLDAENRWFRFHHLFQTLLLNQLKRSYSSEDINVLHARASAWFADNGMIEEAIRHALAAGDANGAAQLVVQNRQAAVNAERWFDLEKWLSILPDVMIQQQPELLLAQAWIHYFHYDYGLIPAVLERAESLLSNRPHRQPLVGELNLLKGIVLFFQGDGARGLKYIEDALEQIPAAHHFIRGTADAFWGLAGQMQGQEERAINRLTNLLQEKTLSVARKMRLMLALVFVYIISGELAVAFSLSQQLKQFAISINYKQFIVWSSYLLGLIHFCRNESDMAIDYLSQAAESGNIIIRRANLDCQGGLASAYQANQQTDKATASINNVNKYIQSLKNPEFLENAHSFTARLALMRGKVPMSSGLLSRKGPSNAYPMLLWLDLPDITQCRVLLAAGTDTDLQEAENKLKACMQLSQAQHNTFQRIHILPLLALVYEKQGRFEEALTVLEEAVNLAVPGGFIRPFVESGPTMVSLLKRLAEKNIAVDYIGHLLDALSPPTHKPPSMAQTSDGQLTNREHDILELLAKRMRTKEIAEKLFISTHTVNAHLKNLYRKLDVQSRRKAVARAKSLGIL